MVQILVKINDDSVGIKEWAVVEVQGDIECNSIRSDGGKFIGHLLFTSKERPVLIIGYHILHGKVVENNPCIAVLQKVKCSYPMSSTSLQTEDLSTEYKLVALVKKKIVFRTRPKPIVTAD